MIVEDVKKARSELARMLSESAGAVAFTGAGISTECGIPDFRSPESAWKRHPPVPFEDFLKSAQARAETWRRKFAMDDIYRGAKPGRGHRALARLVADGVMSAIITQNIDGLHAASGVDPDKIIELHGNGTYAACLDCNARHELVDIRRYFERTQRSPECECGGFIKSATIAFGQAMPQTQMRRAREATLGCDLFLAIGSSLVVYPAAGFPVAAKENGASLVIVNRDPTPLDAFADLVLRGDIGDILEPFERANRLN
ncbi:MAG: SIR2 family NAD-dependent protein deacylase [Beijerinckiaceae bacterium]